MAGGSGMWRGAWLLAALVAACAQEPTPDAPKFEAAFQGRCGEGSPCEQLCRELHDGTFECGCSPGFILHVDGYGCLELNSTKTTDGPPKLQEDVLYSKDVSFSAELVVAPSRRLSNVRESSDVTSDVTSKTTSQPDEYMNEIQYAYTGERTKQAEGIRSLLEDGVSKNELSIMADGKHIKVTTLGPSLEQKVPDMTVAPPWTTALESCNCDTCGKCRNDLNITTPRFSGASWLALRALRGAYKRVRLRVRFRPESGRGVLLLTGEHDDLSGDYLALVLRNGHVELRFDCGSGAGVLRSPSAARLGRWNVVSVYRHRWDAWLRLNTGRRVRGRSKGLFSRMTFRLPVWVGGAGNTTGVPDKLGAGAGLRGCVDYLRINGDTYNLARDALASVDVGECAPSLAPWRVNEMTTSESIPHSHTKKIDSRALYTINDIVHFEDNDLVMRDSKDHNKLENTIDQFKTLVHDFSKIKPINDRQVNKVALDVVNDLKSDDANMMKDDYAVSEAACKCEHGGGCVGNVCLCPLGYAGERCEITLDLKIPRFNGSSYLRLPGLGKSAESWLDIKMTLKATTGNGLVLYSSEHPGGGGDFFSLHLRDYYVEFAFDLGSGVSKVRSPRPLARDTWQQISLSRSGRRAALRVGGPRGAAGAGGAGGAAGAGGASVTARGRGAMRPQQPLLLAGAPPPARARGLSGCIRQLIINDEEISMVASALGGVNVDNCEETKNDTCSTTQCKETLDPVQYAQNLSDSDIHHSIVPKKGIKLKYHKMKSKKHTHIDKYKKKKYYPSKKHQHLQSLDTENEIMTEGPTYDGRTYMQMKYLNANEINWGDANSYPSFSGIDSFIHIDDEETMKRLVSYTLDINIRFRATAPSGLLAWSGAAAGGGARGDFLALAVENSVLVFRYDLGSGEVVIIANHTKVDDGLWHRARATRNRRAGVLEVDGLGSVGKVSPGGLKQLNTNNGLYIGGLPSIEVNTMGKYKRGLVGCVSQISLSGDFDIPLTLSKLPHTITNNVGRCMP